MNGAIGKEKNRFYRRRIAVFRFGYQLERRTVVSDGMKRAKLGQSSSASRHSRWNNFGKSKDKSPAAGETRCATKRIPIRMELPGTPFVRLEMELARESVSKPRTNPNSLTSPPMTKQNTIENSIK